MADKFYVGDIGTEIILNCGEDISAATNLKIKWKKPDDSTGEWAAGDGVVVYQTNYLKYTVKSGDFNQDGTFKFQASLTLGTWSGLGETAYQKIYAAFE